MLVNKKLDRLKQWTSERMGGEVKTNTTDQFKALETEMDLRHQGMEKMAESMSIYMKAVSKRTELEKKDKILPIQHMGSSMIQHSDDFEHDSEYGQCLNTFGRTQERLARAQEAYIIAAQNSWADSLERSLVQMKEYQAARKKLESRRLAYDTSLAKMQKAKREDFRVEEELRSQQLKYEEAEADVERRMFDIKDAEGESLQDLGGFLEAQLAYHEKCREALVQLQHDWPVRNTTQSYNSAPRPAPRPRSNTVRSFMSTHSEKDETPRSPVAERPSIKSRTPSFQTRYADPTDDEPRRPAFGRSTTYQPAAQARRDISPVQSNRLSRVPSDSLMIAQTRSNLRRVDTTNSQQDVFADEAQSYRSVSPQTPQSTGSQTGLVGGRRAPPPPPPSRASKPGSGLGKPAPPPPPMKRTLIA